MSADTCQTCPFAQPRNLANPRPEWPTHECRRHAPVTAVDGNGDELPDFPLVNVGDSCGDHPERDPALKAARIFGNSVVTLGYLMERNDEIAGRIIQSSGLECML